MKKIGWPGHGWKVTCHRCGLWYPSTEIKKEWTGILACTDCYETRHPQTLIKIRGEENYPSFVSKDSEVYTGVCTVASSSGYADLAAADCAQADHNTTP